MSDLSPLLDGDDGSRHRVLGGGGPIGGISGQNRGSFILGRPLKEPSLFAAAARNTAFIFGDYISSTDERGGAGGGGDGSGDGGSDGSGDF